MTTQDMTLGYVPAPLTVVFTTGSDFAAVVKLDTAWPGGTTLTLITGAVSTNASIVGTDATFNIDKAVTDPIADGATARLVYVNGTTDQVWASGKVIRRG